MLTIRHSELKDHRQCPLKRSLRWDEGWVPDEPNPKFELGTQWHYLMAAYFTELRKHDERRDARLAAQAAAEIIPVFTDDEERIELLLWMLDGYVEVHGTHADWEIIAIEPSYTVPLYFDGEHEFNLEINPDLIVRHRRLRNRLVTVDHKSTGQLKRRIEIDLDDQLGLQMLGVGRALDEPVLYPMLNQARTKKLVRPMLLSERYDIKPSFRSADELRMIERDVVLACRELARLLEGEVEEPYSSPNPMTCMYSCDFVEAHIAYRRSGGKDLEQILLARGFSRQGRPPSGSHLTVITDG